MPEPLVVEAGGTCEALLLGALGRTNIVRAKAANKATTAPITHGIVLFARSHPRASRPEGVFHSRLA